MNTTNMNSILLALAVGMMLPLQALVNARLGQLTQGGLFASTVSFLVGTLVLAVVLLSVRVPFPTLQTVTSIPWWAWTGGALGAAFVLSSTLLIPQLGAAKLVCLVVFGQIVGSLLLDHFGVLHSAKPIDLLRLAGGVLVAIGAMLVVQPWKVG